MCLKNQLNVKLWDFICKKNLNNNLILKNKKVKFEERPTYRNLIGKLLLNKESIEIINLDEQIKNSTENISKEIIQVLNHQLKSASQNKIIDKKTTLKPKLNKSIENLNNLPLNFISKII